VTTTPETTTPETTAPAAPTEDGHGKADKKEPPKKH
jgi:hypothetical protein